MVLITPMIFLPTFALLRLLRGHKTGQVKFDASEIRFRLRSTFCVDEIIGGANCSAGRSTALAARLHCVIHLAQKLFKNRPTLRDHLAFLEFRLQPTFMLSDFGLD